MQKDPLTTEQPHKSHTGSSLKDLGPPLLATLFCWLIVAALAAASAMQDSGTFTYPLDDTYIHLSIARTLAQSHVWGIGPAEFGSASSSPGWTVLLAGLNDVVGVHVMLPLLMNIAFAAWLLFLADSGLRTFAPRVSATFRTWALLLFVFFVPLPNLIFVGMEHVAQTVSIFLMVFLGVKVLAQDPGTAISKLTAAGLVASCFFAGAMRYEAVLAVVPLGVALLVRRRVLLTFLAGLAAAVVPLCFGLYSHHLSGFWLPFSVLIKQLVPETTGPMRTHTHLAVMYPLLCLILALFWFLRRRKEGFWAPTQLLILFTFVISLSHRLVAPTGWLLRYESYFVALFVFTVLAVVAQVPGLAEPVSWFRSRAPRERAVIAALVVSGVLIAPYFFYRAVLDGILRTERAAVDRYAEHLEVASFVKQFYDSDAIVVNDIGAVSFYTHAHLLDIVGLGSQRPLDVIRATGHPPDAHDIQEWATAEHVHIAVLQTGWDYVIPRIPRTWIAVASLNFQRNVVFTDRSLTFFATREADVPRLCASLAAFKLTSRDTLTFESGVCPASR